MVALAFKFNEIITRKVIICKIPSLIAELYKQLENRYFTNKIILNVFKELKYSVMFLHLPEELILSIYDFLDFSDLASIYSIHKNIPKISVLYKTYTRNTVYTNKNGTETISKSYLLTNGPKSMPGIIKHNCVEIKLLRGRFMYHFIFYKNIYMVKLDILSYLQNIDWTQVRKLVTVSES